MAGRESDLKPNKARMAAGELYYAFTPDLIADRQRCSIACETFNRAGHVSRRELVMMVKDIVRDVRSLPGPADSAEEEEKNLADEPWVDGPVRMDYGYNVKLGKNVYINFNSVWIDTCTIEVGDRTLIGPNCSFYSAAHPLDPVLRNGTRGPEYGKPIKIGSDCWFGGNCIVLPGVTIGRGVTIGAGSVVTKDVPDFVAIAGNPARVIKEVPHSGEEKIS
ncbi:galactoside O-acetyltransferase [Colletotrichum orchidophilum]|uniref:Galactoside O-acetyltransferase n=1 Tax=Colletotrichum orchidophilum TaxID=1209926 RepID=A0A1G4B8Y0_9PEZI|nr:galactoside O-acetyltransferase [Colletotrichum orchidophilum]OHE97879.1 galactoside O-acetyltransferase [Colletotrichum orchidophilum]